MASNVAQKLIAIVVLAVAGWFLLKVVIGLVAGLATLIAVAVAILAVFWALNKL